MRVPQRVQLEGLPDRVTIYEVGPRDGLQNEKVTIPTQAKVDYITALGDAGNGAGLHNLAGSAGTSGIATRTSNPT